MTKHDKCLVLAELARLTGEFISDGYLYVGSIANTAIGLRHPRNGNRATILATEDTIAIMINGHLRKQITLAELRAQAPASAYSGT
jgi:hypothetical protein